MNIEVNDQAPKFRPIMSRRFCCKTCGYFCIEWTPVLRRGMRAYYEGKRKKLMPRVRLTCPHGHHRFNNWSFVDMQNLRGGKK